MVSTGVAPPIDLELREDLRTRIGSGVTVRVMPLSDSEKHAALLATAHSRGLRLGNEIVDHLLPRHQPHLLHQHHLHQGIS